MGSQARRVTRKQARRKPRWRPEWRESAFEKYAKGWAIKNLWRVQASGLTYEDAMQECALVFARCVDRYVTCPEKGSGTGYGQVDNPAWFMGLYKRALYNYWIKLQWRDESVRRIEAPIHAEDLMSASLDDADEVSDGGYQHAHDSVEYPYGPFVDAMARASDELKRVLHVLSNAPAETMAVLFGELRGEAIFRQEHRTLLNRRIARWCGISGSPDLIDELINLVA